MSRSTHPPGVRGCWPPLLLLWLWLVGAATAQDADDGGCYSPGSIAGIVIATVIVTLVTAALAAAFIWYLWKQRKGGYGEDKCEEKGISCPPMSPDKQLIVHENSEYAFDNPYFKDDETDHVKHDAAEKGESGFRLDNGDITTSQNAKASNGTTNGHQKKNRPFSSLPFHAVFHPSGKKQQQQQHRGTQDDTYISKHSERVVVPLRGHDFTGLGFDICGNMRDGIFVKDVLHRGPATESGKIKAGDRILGVTVSFGCMVYEDALTILSYASPYDVKLEIEKSPAVQPPSPKRLGASTSFRSCGQRRLFHPLYRSRSIDDLTQIGKDSFLGGNSPAVHSKSPKESSATPKRSQSVEASNGGLKTRAAFALKSREEAAPKPSRKSSTSSCESAGKTSTTPLPETSTTQTVTVPKPEAPPCEKKEVKSSRFRVEQITVKSEAPQAKQAPPVKPARDDKTGGSEEEPVQPTTEKPSLPEPQQQQQPQPVDTGDVTLEDSPPAEEVAAEKPTAPPRKAATPAKRRAPAPPPTVATQKTETSADVHRADDQHAQEEATTATDQPDSNCPPPPPTSEIPEPELDHEPEPVLSSDSSSVASECKGDGASSPGKRKASSLGDLTKLEQSGAHKSSSTSSAILERAVSLDLQQSLPGENLVKQKKILRAPTFEDDYGESNESDINIEDNNGGLKRWDNGLDGVFTGLTNGRDHNDDDNDPPQPPEPSKKEDDPEPIPATPTKKVLTADLDLDLDDSSVELESEKQLTSTPAPKTAAVPAKNPSEGDEGDTTTIQRALFSPVTISIPVIKPDLTHFEKLPSPPPANTHPSFNSSSSKQDDSSTGRSQLERISVQSLYRPIFGGSDDRPTVNGIDESDDYDTAVDTSSEISNSGKNAPNSVAGFAKTLIVPGPNEVESLLSLAAEPITPPPHLLQQPPHKPVENE